MTISFLALFLSMEVCHRQIPSEQIQLNTNRKNVLPCALSKSHFSTNKMASIATTIIFTGYALLFYFFHGCTVRSESG